MKVELGCYKEDDKMLKVVTIVGARPQFIKAAAVSRVLRQNCREILVHTGQHYDYNMSQVFFEELEIPEPEYNLGVGSGAHAWQTGQMLMRIEDVLVQEKPDWVLVYGDTNSTLAGALAAAKLNIPVAHVEAGLRSYNRSMPEEVNRVLTDHLSTLLFCPTRQAVMNLVREGFENVVKGDELVAPNYPFSELQASAEKPLVINVGDVMYDALLYNIKIAQKKSLILKSLGLLPKEYYLATIHRAENTDDPARLKNILETLNETEKQVVLPLHPRTRKYLYDSHLESLVEESRIYLTEPVSYLDMLVLEQQASAVITDSGGVQKEAYLFGVPCITLRKETEWVETVNAGANILAGSDREIIFRALSTAQVKNSWDKSVYGLGSAADNIVECLLVILTP